MLASISFPLWLLLVAMIGAPIHFFLRERHEQTRLNYAGFSALTIALAMLVCFPGTRHSLHEIVIHLGWSLSLGMIFGVPLGLVFRGVVVKDR